MKLNLISIFLYLKSCEAESCAEARSRFSHSHLACPPFMNPPCTGAYTGFLSGGVVKLRKRVGEETPSCRILGPTKISGSTALELRNKDIAGY